MIVSSAAITIPPQMLPLKEKDEKWEHNCMDSLESIGRHQFYQNGKLVENYQMVRGKFIFSQYIDREEYGDLVDQLTREFDMPSHLRHYDIISQVINTLSGEWQKRPDIFRAKAHGEYYEDEYLRKKTELLVTFVVDGLNQSINNKLVQEGLDPNKTDFASDEEAQQYQQQVQQRQQALTPPEIEKYMRTKWLSEAEIWANYQLEADKQRFNLPEKEKVEFEDMCASDICFRHFYLTPNYFGQESWNPINTFYVKSPEVIYVEEGDYVGRVFFMSIADIINRHGHKMTKSQLDKLEESKRKHYNSNNPGERDWLGFTPNTVIPSMNYPDQRMTQANLGFDPNNPDMVDYGIAAALGTGNRRYSMDNLYQVTEAYWMSQRKLGKVVYMDSDNQVQTMMVDESFDAKLMGMKEIDNSFMELGDDERINTVTWTWVNQVWKGIKISNRFAYMDEPIYLDIAPNDFQFKGDANIYGAKLPVCGQVFNNRNAESMSLVDLMKPHQIGYNVAMNQLYEIMQREIGRFMLMDYNFIPSGADWGGERNFERLMLIAKQLGVAPLDGSPANSKNSSFSHFQEINLDESARMLSRLKIAESLELFALKQVGITPQRLGDTSASESATGVTQAVNQSYAQTESIFTNFSNFKRRCLKMNLDIAQYVQGRKDSVTLTFPRSDMSTAFMKIAGTDLLMSDFGIFMTNSQENARQLEMLRQYAIQNNTAMGSPADVATIITSNSPAEIRIQLEASQAKAQEMKQSEMNQQQQIQQQQIQAAAQEADKKRVFDAQQNELDRANERYIAEVRGLGMVGVNHPDIDGSGIPDVMEVQKFDAELNKHSEDMLFKREQEMNKSRDQANKEKLDRAKMKQTSELADKQAQENEKDRQVEIAKMRSQEKIAKENKSKAELSKKSK